MNEHQVPVVLEFIVERVTNISMGTEISSVSEFEEILCLDPSACHPQKQLGEHGRSGGGANPSSGAVGELSSSHSAGRWKTTMTNSTPISHALHGSCHSSTGLRWRPKLAFEGSNTSSPTRTTKSDYRRASPQNNGLKQVLFNLPAGNWEAGDRGIACILIGLTNSRTASARAIDYAERLAARK